MTGSSTNDHDKEIEQPRLDGKKSLIDTVLKTAQALVNTVEQFLLLYSMVASMETNTALVAVKAARAVLYLAQTALRVIQNKQR